MISTRYFGTHPAGNVIEAVLESGDVSIAILNFGCVIRDWRVPVGEGRLPVVLGFESFSDYLKDKKSFGVIAGRVANRIAKGQFSFDGTAYRLPVDPVSGHTLHSGATGLGRQIWQLDTDAARNAVRLEYFSPDGEGGFPGNVQFRIVLSLVGAALTCEMSAIPDRPTPINLAQHSYYNLNGCGDIRNHVVEIAASRFTPLDAELIPTGEIAPIDGQVFDFRMPVSVAENDPACVGIDINTILDEGRDAAAPAARVHSPESGVSLRLWTEEPGLQLFNAPEMRVSASGLDGVD